jgi:hypothetical protein
MMGGGAGSQNQGFFQMQAIAPPPPTAQAPKGDPVGAAIGTANQINGLYKAGAKLAGKSATDAGAQKAGEVAAQKAGEAVAEKAVEAGAQKAVETAATDAATTAVTDAATTAATDAAVSGGASALAGGAGAALGAASAALPWVGAAYGVGKLLELWNSGGQVGTQMSDEEAAAKYSEAWNSGDVQDIRQGGKVPGEWQGNTDNVPALLTEDEHVVNAEAAAMIGHDKLEALNKKGLAMRAKGYTPGRIRAAGIKGAK